MQLSGEDLEKNSSLSEALRSFAQHRHLEPALIGRLIRESESFREICADYEECCSKLLSLEQNAIAAGRRLRDYEEMREQLERDLLRYLESTAASQTSARQPEHDEPKTE